MWSLGNIFNLYNKVHCFYLYNVPTKIFFRELFCQLKIVDGNIYELQDIKAKFYLRCSHSVQVHHVTEGNVV